MIFERCAFIIIYASLSSLSPSSARAASIILDSTTVRDEIILDRHGNKPQHSSQDISLQLAQKSNLETEKLTSQDISSSEFVQTQSDRYWALGAMALTSSIALFLLWVLFRKPQDSNLVIENVVPETKLSEEVKPSVSRPDSANLASEKTASDSNSIGSSTANGSVKTKTLNSPVAYVEADREPIQDLQAGNRTNNNTSEEISTDLSNPELQISRRHKVVSELTNAADYPSIEPLLKIMPEAPEADKSAIVEAVSQITRRSFELINQQLFTDLQDSNPEVRLNAVRDLKHLYQFVTPAIAKIALMQSDPDYQVRQTAIQTLKYLNADPLPTFDKPVAKSLSEETDDLVSGSDSEANLHLVAYLLAELDAEK